MMKKVLSILTIAATLAVVLPSCSYNDDFDEVVINQIDEPGSEESGNDQDPKGGNEKPGGS